MIMRDKTQSIVPELLKRFKNKNVKIACFSMEAVVNAFKNQLLLDEHNIRSIFKAASPNVGNTNKEVRDITIEMIREIYKVCTDDAATLVKNLSNLRSIQVKEITDVLQDVSKQSTGVSLFSKEYQGNNEAHTPKKQRTKLDLDNEPHDQKVIIKPIDSD